MDKENNYPEITEAPSTGQINIMKMELLTLVPKFQKEVKSIRKKFSIPKTGFDNDNEVDAWFKENKFQPFLDLPSSFNSERFDPFKKSIYELGEKFKLPYNFYYGVYTGVARYVLYNFISGPMHNWDLDYGNDNAKSKISIVSYGDLDKDDFKEAKKALIAAQKEHMSKEKTLKINVRKKFWLYRNVIDSLIGKPGKPKMVKKYKEGTYLYHLEKAGQEITSEAERLNPFGVSSGLNKKPSHEIGEKHNIRGINVRQAFKRLDELAEKLFGYGLK